MAATLVLFQRPDAYGQGIGGLAEVPMTTATDGANVDQDCTSNLEEPADDIVGCNNGFVTLSDLTLQAAA